MSDDIPRRQPSDVEVERDQLRTRVAKLKEALADILRYCSEPIEETHELLEKDIFAKARSVLNETQNSLDIEKA